jgi:transcriptional regulator with XRE-family HTH domain
MMTGKPQQTSRKAAERPQAPAKSDDKRTVKLDRERLLGLRTNAGWSQARLAQASGLSQDTISRAENSRPIRLGMAETLAQTFDLELAQLLPPQPTADQGAPMTSAAGSVISLIAIGLDIVCTGSLTHIGASSWEVRLDQFVIGDLHSLSVFIDGFSTRLPETRCLLSSELGDGRLLTAAPKLTMEADGHRLLCPVAPSFPRVDVQAIGSSLASHPDTNDIFLDKKNNIARVAGLDYFPQRVREALSLQFGESPPSPFAGVRFFEYLSTYQDAPWLDLFFNLEVIRLASIPLTDVTGQHQYTPLQSVTRVRSVELLSKTPSNGRVPVRVVFDVQGLGAWDHTISVCIPTPEQMVELAKRIAQHRRVWAATKVITVAPEVLETRQLRVIRRKTPG